MGWLLQCLLWVVLATSSAYRPHYNGYLDYSNYGYYPEPNRESSYRHHDPGFEPGTHRHGYGHHHERLNERSAERHSPYGERTNEDRKRTIEDRERTIEDRERTNEQHEDRKNADESKERTSDTDRPSQRMNERSIAVTSSIQRVQNQERKRLQTRDDDAPRIENGTYKIVNKFPVHSHRRGAIEDRVVFPDDTMPSRVQTRIAAPSFLDNLPASCQELGICDDVPDEEAYNRIVNSALQKHLDTDSLKTIDQLDNNPAIAQRIGIDTIETQLCSYQERVMLPKAAKDKDDKWHILLNRKDDPIQGYRVEICNQGRSNCTAGIFHYYKGYTGYCKQKYSFRPMTAVDPVTNATYTVPLKVPSCCSCVAVQV